MKFSNICNIDDLKKYCNRKSTKNMNSYTKPTSPLPHLVVSHTTSPSGSINIIELSNENSNVILGIKYLIFSYDSLIGCVRYRNNKLYVINPNEYKTTRTTQKILSHLYLISDFILVRRDYCILLDIFKLYTYYYLKYKGDNKDE